MASYYDLISENDESTVVSSYESSFIVSEGYISEGRLELQICMWKPYIFCCIRTNV